MLSAQIKRTDYRGKIIKLMSGGIVVPISGRYGFCKYECIVVQPPPRLKEVYRPGDLVTMDYDNLAKGEEIPI